MAQALLSGGAQQLSEEELNALTHMGIHMFHTPLQAQFD